MALQPGSQLGPYRIVEQVGKGGMAVVYKAYHPSLSRYVAIKVLPDFFAQEPTFLERFRQEAVAIAQLRHPHILTVYDYGEEKGTTFIVYEYIPGGTLRDQLCRPLPPDYALSILRLIASALDYAHARGILHQDVKPSNILLTPEGTPVLADFGLAKILERSTQLTQSGTTVSTPEYMAPEQATDGETGPATDVYSLGVILYEMLVGQVPFTADTPMAVVLMHLHHPLPLPRSKNPNLSPEVEAVLLKALAKEPRDRFQSAGELMRALEAAIYPHPSPTLARAGAPGEAETLAREAEEPAVPIKGRARPSPILWLLGLLLAALLGSGLVFLVSRGDEGPAPVGGIASPTPPQAGAPPVAPLTATAVADRPRIKVTAPGATMPDIANVTVAYANNTDAPLSEVVIVVPFLYDTGTFGPMPERGPEGESLFRQPDLPPRARATFQTGVFRMSPGPVQLSFIVRAKGVPEARTEPLTITADPTR